MFNLLKHSVIEGNFTNLEENKLVELRNHLKEIKNYIVENIKLLISRESYFLIYCLSPKIELPTLTIVPFLYRNL
jgi:hypothetical protein